MTKSRHKKMHISKKTDKNASSTRAFCSPDAILLLQREQHDDIPSHEERVENTHQVGASTISKGAARLQTTTTTYRPCLLILASGARRLERGKATLKVLGKTHPLLRFVS